MLYRFIWRLKKILRSKDSGSITAPNPVDGSPSEYTQRVWEHYKKTRLGESK